MALIDLIQVGSTTHTYTSAGAVNVGATGNELDGDWATYYGIHYHTSAAQYVQCDHTWATPRRVDQVDFSFYGYAYEYGDDTGYVWLSYKLQWYNGSTWADITGSTYSDYHSQYHDSLSISVTSGHVTLTGLDLSGCYGIRAYAYARAYNNSNNNSNVTLYIYEVQAWAEVYSDIGLKYSRGGTTYKIGADTLTAAHKLRIRKGGVTYGIPLLSTGDSHASKVRIYSGGAVKALPLFE